jgi:hypothetical protein
MGPHQGEMTTLGIGIDDSNICKCESCEGCFDGSSFGKHTAISIEMLLYPACQGYENRAKGPEIVFVTTH